MINGLALLALLCNAAYGEEAAFWPRVSYQWLPATRCVHGPVLAVRAR